LSQTRSSRKDVCCLEKVIMMAKLHLKSIFSFLCTSISMVPKFPFASFLGAKTTGSKLLVPNFRLSQSIATCMLKNENGKMSIFYCFDYLKYVSLNWYFKVFKHLWLRLNDHNGGIRGMKKVGRNMRTPRKPTHTESVHHKEFLATAEIGWVPYAPITMSENGTI